MREGVRIRRSGRTLTVDWSNVLGVRHLGTEPGYVQLLVRNHVPRGVLDDDEWTIAVNSEPDANRLVTDLGWRARGRGLSVEDIL